MWEPKAIQWVVRDDFDTSTSPIIVQTDDGAAYAKILGNPEGPTALACELVGLGMAYQIGLDTPDTAILDFPEELCTAKLGKGCKAQPGPALLLKEVKAQVWGGTVEELDRLSNPEAIAGLVVLDTWLRNYDRYAERNPPPHRRNERNVLLASDAPAGQFRLLAIDMDHAFRTSTELNKACLTFQNLRDTTLFGLFPEFALRLRRDDAATFAERLRSLPKEAVRQIVAKIPHAWLPDRQLRDQLSGFISDRARFVGEKVEKWLEAPCAWELELLQQSTETDHDS